MDMLNVDVRGVPDERIRELQQFIEHWKRQARTETAAQAGENDLDKDIVFATHDSRVYGDITRAAAYD